MPLTSITRFHTLPTHPPPSRPAPLSSYLPAPALTCLPRQSLRPSRFAEQGTGPRLAPAARPPADGSSDNGERCGRDAPEELGYPGCGEVQRRDESLPGTETPPPEVDGCLFRAAEVLHSIRRAAEAGTLRCPPPSLWAAHPLCASAVCAPVCTLRWSEPTGALGSARRRFTRFCPLYLSALAPAG